MRIVQAEPFAFETPAGERVPLRSLSAGTRLALFGAGGRGSEVLGFLRKARPDLNPVCFIDSFKAGERDGLEVVKFDDFAADHLHSVDRVIVCSFCATAMVEQLAGIGVTDPLLATLGRQEGLLELMHELYPMVQGEFNIESLEGMKDGSTRIVVANAEGVVPCRWSVDNGEEQFSSAGEIALPESQADSVCVRGVVDGGHGFEFTLSRVSVDKAEVGNDPASCYIFEPGDVRFVPKSRIDYGPSALSQEDIDYARGHWGDVVTEGDDYSCARNIASAMIVELAGTSGSRIFLDDVFSCSPIEYYRKACEGELPVLCGQMAAAFQDVCRIFGIMCRIVNVRRTEDLGYARYHINGGHAVNEVYCRNRRQWIFMDLQRSVLGVGFDMDVLLNILEFHSFIHSSRRDHLLVVCVDEDGVSMKPLCERVSPECMNSTYHVDMHCIFNMN